MADIGYISLFMALAASVFSAVAYVAGARNDRQPVARAGLLVSFALVSIASAVLLLALFTHNFGLEYVASYSSRDTSVPYLLSAFWAGNAGSLLFWAWVLSLLAVVFAVSRRSADAELVPYAAAIAMITQAFFLLILVSVANPFLKLPNPPADGVGLNPLLENPGMIFHPPALLGGYVAFTIPFALAIAALITRRLGNEWLHSVRRWMLLAWLLLGVGNIIGAWWAYVELGWGGYWAWDPVENAGLMPWLIATAFLHSTMAQRRRGMLKMWNMALVTLAFILSIFGTFLTRSNILSSVHNFGDLGLGPFFTTFIVLALIGSVWLIFSRRDDLKDDAEIEHLVSRESTFLINNLLMVGATFAIFLGTVFPAISELVRGAKIEVGASFFNTVNAPIFLAVIVLAGLCAAIGWQHKPLKSLGRTMLPPFAAAVVVGLMLLITGISGAALAAFFLCSFVLFMILYQWFMETRERHQARSQGYLTSFWGALKANRPRYGGYIVHLSLVLMAIGVAGSSFFSVSKEGALKFGESMSINDYTLTYDDMGHSGNTTKLTVTATLSVRQGDKSIGIITPEKLFTQNYQQPVTEVAIRSTPKEDLYVILLGWDTTGNTGFKILVNPLVAWIWIGGILFLLGGLVAFWPERHRIIAEKGGRLEEAGKEDAEGQKRGGFCSKCGAKFQPGDRFCSRCGARTRT